MTTISQSKTLIAKILSALSSPLVLFLAPFALLSIYAETFSLTIIVFSFLLIQAPLLTMLRILKRNKAVTNFNVSNQTERMKVLPLFLLSLVFLIVMFCLLFPSSTYALTATLLIAIIELLVIGFLLKRQTAKASFHLTMLSTITVLLLINFSNLILLTLLILLLILVGWSRIILKEHTLTETVSGTLIGFVSTILVLLILNII